MLVRLRESRAARGGDGPPAVFVHGLGSDKDSPRNVVIEGDCLQVLTTLPDTCIDAVAEALYAQILTTRLAPVLAAIGPQAEAFWYVPPDRRRAVSFPA